MAISLLVPQMLIGTLICPEILSSDPLASVIVRASGVSKTRSPNLSANFRPTYVLDAPESTKVTAGIPDTSILTKNRLSLTISGPRGWQNSTTSRNFPNSAVAPMLYRVAGSSIKIFFSPSEDSPSRGFGPWCNCWLIHSSARLIFSGTALFLSSSRDELILSASVT